jgi:hypothetical protein
MRIQSLAAITIAAAIGLPNFSNAKEPPLMMHAKGTFEVKMLPQAADEAGGGATVGRLFIDKQFHGDLEAKSVGTMLGVRTKVEGSAGYVAQEVVTGTLDGHKGSFVLQHTGMMTKGALEQSVVVIPDSGTEGLSGIAGKMTIVIENGQHHYTLDYTLP